MKIKPIVAIGVLGVLAGCAGNPSASSSGQDQIHETTPKEQKDLVLTEDRVFVDSSFVQPTWQDDHVVAADPLPLESTPQDKTHSIQKGTKQGLIWNDAGGVVTQGLHPDDMSRMLREHEMKMASLSTHDLMKKIDGKQELVVWFDFADPNPAPRFKAEAGAMETLRRSSVVWVVGHADAIGTDAANMALSRKRADHVRDWLVAHGVPSSIIRVTYMGERSPVAPNETEEGRAQNRRVEVYARH